MARTTAAEQAIVRLMLGAEPPKPAHLDHEAEEVGEPVLDFRAVTVLDPYTGVGLKAVDLKVYAGEIVGIAGVSGNGQSELANVALGLRRIDEGEYGYCEVTGEPISLARLEARPIATMTIEAQERHERNEKISRDE